MLDSGSNNLGENPVQSKIEHLQKLENIRLGFIDSVHENKVYNTTLSEHSKIDKTKILMTNDI